MRLPSRRFRGILIVLVLSLAAWCLWLLFTIGLAPTSLYSGFSLLFLVLFLTLFNVRKKLPFLPLMRASVWMRWHAYLGFFSIVLFLIHIDFRLPTGPLEGVLATVFTAVAVSGIFGMILSKQLPKRMTRAGESLVYERIPRLRQEIRDNVQALVLDAEESCRSSTLSEFYFEHLRHFLEQRPGLFHPFGLERRRPSHRLTNELEARMRYLSDEEKPIAAELEEWISTKENLDFQEASQRLLKGWLFFHIPLTYSLILLAFAHAILALLYGGNA